MKAEPKEVVLKDGRKCILRSAELTDAEAFRKCVQLTCSETGYMLRTPEEVADYTLEKVTRYIKEKLENPKSVLLLADIDGEIAGSCKIAPYGAKKKFAHRGKYGISIIKKYWSAGLGKELTAYVLEIADTQLGHEMIDLDVVSENTRAVGLYEKFGFEKLCQRPNVLKMDDGTYYGEFVMCRYKK